MSAPPRLYVSNEVVSATYKALGKYGSRRVEAGCLWYGVRTETASIALLLGIPRQHNERGSFSISGESLADLTERAGRYDLVAVAQVHTHPGTNVCHSPWDDLHMVSERIYSLVLPIYGKGKVLNGVGVHRFDDDRWSLLTGTEVRDSLFVTPGMVDLR